VPSDLDALLLQLPDLTFLELPDLTFLELPDLELMALEVFLILLGLELADLDGLVASELLAFVRHHARSFSTEAPDGTSAHSTRERDEIFPQFWCGAQY
jgi:hypothetical protein